MKVLVYFPRKKFDVFFEGAMLENKIKKACKTFTVVDKFSFDVDIANFINLEKASLKVIHQAISQSIPTLLWMFFANNDEHGRIIETKRDGTTFLSKGRLDTINMMDGVVVPTNEAKILLRRYGVRIPVFVINGAANINRVSELSTNGNDNIFRRYFRINAEQKYAFAVMNMKSKTHLAELNLLAAAVPEYLIYAFLSTGHSFINQLKLRNLQNNTEKNLIIASLVPEDVYRTGLSNASYFLDLGTEKVSIMSLYEPMYLKIPIIAKKEAAFSELIDEERAFIVNDFSGAAYVMRNALDAKKRTEKAFAYTRNVTEATFVDGISKLFTKIYTR